MNKLEGAREKRVCWKQELPKNIENCFSHLRSYLKPDENGQKLQHQSTIARFKREK